MTEVTENEVQTISLNDKEYKVDELSDKAKYLVSQVQDMQTQANRTKEYKEARERRRSERLAERRATYHGASRRRAQDLGRDQPRQSRERMETGWRHHGAGGVGAVGAGRDEAAGAVVFSAAAVFRCSAKRAVQATHSKSQ